MKILYILLFISLIPLLGIAQKDELKGKIIWDENRPLTWSDFKARDVGELKFFAYTNSGMYYQVRQTSRTRFLMFVETYFDPYASWQKKKLVTDYLLEHEQLHFDIHELYTRLFIKALLETKFENDRKVLTTIRELYTKTMKDAADFADLYDKETNHSINEEQQLAWNKKVKDLLDGLKPYDQKEFSLEVR